MVIKSKHIIFHIDGDAFFASVEQSTDLSLRGKPIAVGRERGVATAFSYEAKALGVKRGMSGKEIKQDFPGVLLVSSDYRKYGLYSRRFKQIVKNMTGEIEGMSIDECFADVSHMATDYDQARELALRLQEELCIKLGMTFSIGVGPNKTIAKIASGLNKPKGITVINPESVSDILHPLHISKVSGIGFNSVIKLEQLGVYTVADLVNKPAGWSKDILSKPYQELIRELQGEFVKNLELVSDKPKSISKIRAFAPATRDKEYLLSEFARNAEIIAKKLHREGLQARKVVLAMKIPKYDSRMKNVRIELVPETPVTSARDMLQLITTHFEELYVAGFDYRATYIGVHGLGAISRQYDLFGEQKHKREYNAVSELTQKLEKQYGPFVLHTAASLGAVKKDSYTKPNIHESGNYDGMPLLHSRAGDKVLYIPYLGTM